ncbi:MAG: hypothetical protein PUF65_05120 [Lachnospiraceae bacterium]|nr:hypothetical protein [Lachnospiraceae bacterium]
MLKTKTALINVEFIRKATLKIIKVDGGVFMNKNNRITILVYVFLIALSIVACGKKDEFSETQQEICMQTSESADSDIKKDKIINTESSSANQQESSTQKGENADSEMTSEELLDLFINGSIDAIDATDMTSVFNITDFSMNSEKGDSYSIGERVDLDNDGENELIICGPYGGIYIDARNNKVYEFAEGDGNTNILSYTYYNGEIWIMYSNSMNVGHEAYHMVKFEGADNIVAEMSFGEEPVDENNSESGMKYLLNGKEISYDEYTAFCSKIFAAEESTN